MPLYEYHCQDCGQKFEKLTRFSNRDEKVTCPSCGGSRTKRAISLFATRSGSSTAGSEVAASCAPAGGG